jgi:hypothetical protein
LRGGIEFLPHNAAGCHDSQVRQFLPQLQASLFGLLPRVACARAR